jgi:hypothetical protein
MCPWSLCVQVAQAPHAAAPRVQAMSELDQGWLPSKAESDDIDLSLLTACLLPSEQVRQCGLRVFVWPWRSGLIFAALCSPLVIEL